MKLTSEQTGTQQTGMILLGLNVQVYLLIYLNNLHQLMWFSCAQEVKPVPSPFVQRRESELMSKRERKWLWLLETE